MHSDTSRTTSLIAGSALLLVALTACGDPSLAPLGTASP
jgi:hypothetical protein